MNFREYLKENKSDIYIKTIGNKTYLDFDGGEIYLVSPDSIYKPSDNALSMKKTLDTHPKDTKKILKQYLKDGELILESSDLTEANKGK